MKAIFVVLTIFSVAVLGQLTDEQKEKLRGYKETCITETGVDATVVENAKNGEFPESDEKLDCFAKCMLEKTKLMNEDGTINLEKARSKLPSTVSEDQIDNVINECRNLPGDGCTKAGNVLKCFIEKKTFTLLH